MKPRPNDEVIRDRLHKIREKKDLGFLSSSSWSWLRRQLNMLLQEKVWRKREEMRQFESLLPACLPFHFQLNCFVARIATCQLPLWICLKFSCFCVVPKHFQFRPSCDSSQDDVRISKHTETATTNYCQKLSQPQLKVNLNPATFKGKSSRIK